MSDVSGVKDEKSLPPLPESPEQPEVKPKMADAYEEFLEEYGFYDEASEFIRRARETRIVEFVTSYQRFREIIENEILVVAVYTTPTCSACALYKPIYYIVASDHQDGIKWIEVDAYQAPEAAFEYGVTATPTTIIFMNGEPVDGFVGIMDEEGLWEAVKPFYEKTKQ